MPDDIDTDDMYSSGRIEAVDLQTEMQRSYMDYAMSVIVSRARFLYNTRRVRAMIYGAH